MQISPLFQLEKQDAFRPWHTQIRMLKPCGRPDGLSGKGKHKTPQVLALEGEINLLIVYS